MKTQQSKENLVWIDLEMTGLDPERERIIEIATLITDSQLNYVAEGPNFIIKQPKDFLDGMDEWNQKQHGNSGLIDSVIVFRVVGSESIICLRSSAFVEGV